MMKNLCRAQETCDQGQQIESPALIGTRARTESLSQEERVV